MYYSPRQSPMYFHGFRIDEPFTSHVALHRADAPNTKASGTISFSAEKGVEVTCQPALFVSYPWLTAPEGTVLGTLESGDKFTIPNAIGTWNFGDDNSVQRLTAFDAVIGEHFPSRDHFSIKQINCEFANLNEWVSDGPFRNESADRDEGESPTVTNLQYRVDLAPLETGHIAALDATMLIGMVLNRTGMGHEVKLSVSHYIAFCFDNPVNLRKAVQASYQTELLLTLLVGVSSRLRRITMYVDTNPHAILYYLTRRFGTGRERYYDRRLMPANYDSLKGKLFTIMDKWFADQERFQPVLDLLSASLYETNQFLNGHFLTLAQAIEGYCRIASDDKYMSKDEFQSILTQLLLCLKDCENERFREKAKTSLGFLNDYSLRDRLLVLFQRNPWLEKVLGLGQGMFALTPDDFCRNVTRLRNALTHVESSRRKAAPDSVATMAAIFSMRRILAALLLTNAGVDIPSRLTEVRPEIGAQWW